MWTVLGPNALPTSIVEGFVVREIAVDVPGIRRGVRIRLGNSDSEIFRQIFMARDYDQPMPDDVRVVVDAGANVGYSTLWFAHRFPAARIVALEPDRANFRQLLANCGGLETVSFVEGALWSHDTNLALVDRSEDGERLSGMLRQTVEGADAQRRVPALSVTTLMARHGLERIDVFKIDIEGSEREVFRDGELGWVDKVRCFIIEVHDFFRAGASDAVFDALPESRYRRTTVGENIFFHRRD